MVSVAGQWSHVFGVLESSEPFAVRPRSERFLGRGLGGIDLPLTGQSRTINPKAFSLGRTLAAVKHGPGLSSG